MRLDDFFFERAELCPDAIALEIPDTALKKDHLCLTYGALSSKGLAIACCLKEKIAPEQPVVLAFERTNPDVFASLLGVLRAGGVYCSTDLSFPDERIEHIVADCRPAMVLTSEDQKARILDIVDASCPVYTIEELLRLEPRQQEEPARKSDDGTALAYLIYTSGTTGRPKAVMIEHGQISNLIASNREYFSLGENDRVFQLSSLSYDSSVEEIFMAWSVGASLVVGSDRVVRLGPDLPDWLSHYGITVFTPPPTLLRTMGDHRVASSLTALRLLYVGGEALTQDVVENWAPGRRLVNGYGPTECSVTVVRGDIVPGGEITIGKPVDNHCAFVLDEHLNQVDPGEQGELFIVGKGVGRGYLNQPELTANKFFHHPVFGRGYRTGDLVSECRDGTFLFFGRIDTQVKLRGYRIELTEIESRLCEESTISAAACKLVRDAGRERLVAFVVAEKTETFDESSTRKRLGDVLPSYMMPSQFVVIDDLPRLTSGKVDRKSLPSVESIEPAVTNALHYEPEDSIERALNIAMSQALGIEGWLNPETDFFEMGGDSLSAAVFVSTLRKDQTLGFVAVRDVYEHPTILGLRDLLKTRASDGASLLKAPSVKGSPLNCTFWQCVVLSCAGILGGAFVYGLFNFLLPMLIGDIGWVALFFGVLFLQNLLALLWLPAALGLAVGLKKLLLGTYQAGQKPIWGTWYFRHWLVTKAARLIPWSQFQGTVLHNWVLRCLGVKLGDAVYIHRGVSFMEGGWDLITLEDGVTLSRDVALRPIEYRSLEAHADTIHIGRDATLETRSGVSAGGVVGEQAELAPHACVRPGVPVPPGKRLTGSNYEQISDPVRTMLSTSEGWSPVGYAIRFLLCRWLIGLSVSLPTFLAVVWLVLVQDLKSDALLAWLFESDLVLDGDLLLLMIGLTALLPLQLVWRAVLCRGLGAIPIGRHSIYSAPFLKSWLKEDLMIGASRWLSGTLFWPHWLKLSGMRVGPDCEISTVMEYVPEHVELKGRCFSADGIYFGVPPIAHGTVEYAYTSYSTEVFLGNHAVIQAGTQLAQGVLLGVGTTSPQVTDTQSSWFGNPSFELPNREVVEMDERLTHSPSLIRYTNRLFWECLRFLLPIFGLVAFVFWCRFSYSDDPLSIIAVVRSIFGLMCVSAAAIFIVFVLKWGLLGRVRPGVHPLWSCWCSRWDFVYVAWGALCRPILTVFEGSLVLNSILRWFGVRIGKSVFLGHGFAQVVDPDMLNFEDRTTVTNLFQAHSFEDRVLKVAPVRFESGSSIGAGTIVLYGAHVDVAARVSEQSVVMKNEYIAGRQEWLGAPTALKTKHQKTEILDR